MRIRATINSRIAYCLSLNAVLPKDIKYKNAIVIAAPIVPNKGSAVSSQPGGNMVLTASPPNGKRVKTPLKTP
jgi:hypothetical protein